MKIENIRNKNSVILELTKEEFFNVPPLEIGFNGKTWERNIKAVIVDGIIVFDRKNRITKRGNALFLEWLKKRFDHTL